jgi:hypothetical protein
VGNECMPCGSGSICIGGTCKKMACP